MSERAIKFVQSDWMDDWWVIEWAEHDNRTWFERTGPRSQYLMTSGRISDADMPRTRAA